jgi:hypothetical protein
MGGFFSLSSQSSVGKASFPYTWLYIREIGVGLLYVLQKGFKQSRAVPYDIIK